MGQQDDNEGNVNRCSGHEAVPDSELHRLVRHWLKLPEPRGSHALTDEEGDALKGKVSNCPHCQRRLTILQRSEALNREESQKRLEVAAATAQIKPERMKDLLAAYDEQLARGARLRAQLTAGARSGQRSGLGDVGDMKLEQLRTAVTNDDPKKLVSLLSPESSSAVADPRSAGVTRTERVLEILLSEMRNSEDRETRKSIEAAEVFFMAKNGDLDRLPLDVSGFQKQKRFVCFLILLGYQTLLRLLKQPAGPLRVSAPGKPLSSAGQLDLRPLFGSDGRISAAQQRHRPRSPGRPDAEGEANS
jgi:hypothetical protein